MILEFSDYSNVDYREYLIDIGGTLERTATPEYPFIGG